MTSTVAHTTECRQRIEEMMKEDPLDQDRLEKARGRMDQHQDELVRQVKRYRVDDDAAVPGETQYSTSG